MKFRKVTSHKYIGDNGFSLIQANDGSFAIYKDFTPTSWGNYFVSVKAAECIMNTHDYTKATADNLPMNEPDIAFIINMYCGEVTQEEDDIIHDRYTLTDEYSIAENTSSPAIDVYRDGKLIRSFTDGLRCTEYLDRIVNRNIFSSVILRGTELRSILCAKSNPRRSNDARNARQATQNLVRVKSSNVWARGIEIKDRKAKEGDVYMQFKGKNGGPGDVYVYYNVPIATWRRILAYPSPGSSVWKFLRNNFLYSKLSGDKRGKLPNAVNNI